MLHTQDKYELPAVVTVEVIPPKNLHLPHVLKTVHDTVLREAQSLCDDAQEGEPEAGTLDPGWLASFEVHCAKQEYEAFPDPCDRLAAGIKLILSLNDEEDHSECFWPPFLETAKQALVKLESGDESVRLDVFRDFFFLRERYGEEWKKRTEEGNHDADFPGCPLGAAIEDAIPVYHDDLLYQDVRVKVQPVDEHMRSLNWRLSWFEWLCKPGPKLYVNGVPQPYPVESPRTHTRRGKRFTTQAELKALTVKTRQEADDHARGILKRELARAKAQVRHYEGIDPLMRGAIGSEGFRLADQQAAHFQSALDRLDEGGDQ